MPMNPTFTKSAEYAMKERKRFQELFDAPCVLRMIQYRDDWGNVAFYYQIVVVPSGNICKEVRQTSYDN